MIDNIKTKILRWLIYKLDPRLGGDVARRDLKINQLLQKIQKLEKKVGDPREVIKKLTDNQFKFFDYTTMDEEGRRGHYESAQTALRSTALQNIVKQLNSRFAIWAANQSENHTQLINMRHQISGINMLIEELEEIPKIDSRPAEVEEPNAVL